MRGAELVRHASCGAAGLTADTVMTQTADYHVFFTNSSQHWVAGDDMWFHDTVLSIPD